MDTGRADGRHSRLHGVRGRQRAANITQGRGCAPRGCQTGSGNLARCGWDRRRGGGGPHGPAVQLLCGRGCSPTQAQLCSAHTGGLLLMLPRCTPRCTAPAGGSGRVPQSCQHHGWDSAAAAPGCPPVALEPPAAAVRAGERAWTPWLLRLPRRVATPDASCCGGWGEAAGGVGAQQQPQTARRCRRLGLLRAAARCRTPFRATSPPAHRPPALWQPAGKPNRAGGRKGGLWDHLSIGGCHPPFADCHRPGRGLPSAPGACP